MDPIGFIRSPFEQKFATPRQANLVPSAQCSIEFDPDRLPFGSLEGLNEFSHLWLLFLFHKNTPGNTGGKVQPPRLDGKKVGALATRTPHRPNPIGLSLVELIDIDEKKNRLYFSGADMIDGTPVLDIKPYIESYDFPKNAKASWVETQTPHPLTVEFSESAQLSLQQHPKADQLKSLLEESLCWDTRNLEAKKLNSSETLFKSRIMNRDIHYKYIDSKVEILDIKKEN